MVKYRDIDPKPFEGRTSVKPNELKGKRELTRIVPYSMVKKGTPPDIGIKMYRLEANIFRLLRYWKEWGEIKVFKYQTPRYQIFNRNGHETHVQLDFIFSLPYIEDQRIIECKGRLGAPQLARYKLFAKQHPELYRNVIFVVCGARHHKNQTVHKIKTRVHKSINPFGIWYEAELEEQYGAFINWQTRSDWDLMLQLQQIAERNQKEPF